MPKHAPQTLSQLTESPNRQAIITTTQMDSDGCFGNVLAKCDAKMLHVDWNDTLGIHENHCAAALALLTELGWHENNHLVCGSTGPDGYVFVQVPTRKYPTPDLEYAVNNAHGREHVFKLGSEASEFAITVALTGCPNVTIDVLCWSRDAAVAYGGDYEGRVYDQDPDASVHDRIKITAESTGRVA